jgi:hypothetical protein
VKIVQDKQFVSIFCYDVRGCKMLGEWGILAEYPRRIKTIYRPSGRAQLSQMNT